ncbi:MAG: hypothetical protein ABW221_28335 [Vicinamibacteria bacterium]
MRLAPIRRGSVLLLAALAAACGTEKKTAAPAAGGAPHEARAIAAARPFMEALVAQDQAKAYGFTSSHLRAAMTQDAFTQKNRAAYASLGTPLRLDNLGAEVDPAVLAGPENPTGDDELEKAANRVLAHVALGDIPASVPASVRRASVSGNVVFGKSEDEEGTDPFYVLTVVLVEDAGQLLVGHYFFREASMLDD